MISDQYPDLALVGQTVVYIYDIPKGFEDEREREQLRQEIINIANKAGEGFHKELAADAYVKEGSLVIDIFFNCELSTLLSVENLKSLGVYIGDEVILGIKAGTTLYTISLTFRAIKRLERGMSKICIALKHYVFFRTSASKNIIKQDKKDIKIGEGRSGILGLLSRLYDAVDVCKSTSPIKERLNAITRVRNAVNTIDVAVKRNEDRIFLCKLLSPLMKSIPKCQTESNKDEEAMPYKEMSYNDIRDHIINKIDKICQIK